MIRWLLCRLLIALNGFAAATVAGAPASPVLNGPAALSTQAIYGNSAFFQLGSPSATFAVRITVADPRAVWNWLSTGDMTCISKLVSSLLFQYDIRTLLHE